MKIRFLYTEEAGKLWHLRPERNLKNDYGLNYLEPRVDVTVNLCTKQANMNMIELFTFEFECKLTFDKNITTVTTKCAIRPKNLDATRLPMNIL